MFNFISNLVKSVNNKKHSKQIKKNTRPTKLDYTYLNFFSIALVVKLALVDGKMNECEKATILDECRKKSYSIKESINILSLASKDQNDVEQYTRKILILYPKQQHIYINILTSLITVAASDDNINKKEMNFIKNIASHFYITSTTINELMHHIFIPQQIDDPYLFLGLDKNSNQNTLKQSYRLFAKTYHPDNYFRNSNIASEYKEIMNKKFKLINQAFSKIRQA